MMNDLKPRGTTWLEDGEDGIPTCRTSGDFELLSEFRARIGRSGDGMITDLVRAMAAYYGLEGSDAHDAAIDALLFGLDWDESIDDVLGEES